MTEVFDGDDSRPPSTGGAGLEGPVGHGADPCVWECTHDTSHRMDEGTWVMPDRATSGGVELTDEVLDGLAAQAEAGYDLDQVRDRRPREQ